MKAPHLEQSLWSRSIPYSGGLSWIDGNALYGNDESEESNRRAQKRALIDVGEEFFCLEFGTDRVQMRLVLHGGSTVDQDVIKIDDHELTSEGAHHLVHQTHEGAWSVGEAERHHEPLLESLSGFERHLPLVSRADSYLMIPVSQIKLGEYCSAGELVE